MRREKQNEFATYKSLHLNREVKSARRRQRGEDDQIHVWIGDHSSDRPYRKVLRSKYLEALELELRESADQERPAGPRPPQWADLLRQEIERRVYDRLAQHAAELSALENSFEQSHGRPMTPHEAGLYASAVLRKAPPEKHPAPDARSQSARRHLLGGLIKKIRLRHRNQPDKLQEFWAQAVGTEAAMQTNLTSINRQRGIAYARSLSPTLNQKITRDPEVLKKLSTALNCTIQRIVFR